MTFCYSLIIHEMFLHQMSSIIITMKKKKFKAECIITQLKTGLKPATRLSTPLHYVHYQRSQSTIYQITAYSYNYFYT